LTVGATVLVGIVTDGGVLELARARVATSIVAATFCTATVTLFVTLDDAVAAGLTGQKSHAFVVAETARLDAVSLKGRTDVTNGTG
jgi:hypothetical protein